MDMGSLVDEALLWYDNFYVDTPVGPEPHGHDPSRTALQALRSAEGLLTGIVRAILEHHIVPSVGSVGVSF